MSAKTKRKAKPRCSTCNGKRWVDTGTNTYNGEQLWKPCPYCNKKGER